MRFSLTITGRQTTTRKQSKFASVWFDSRVRKQIENTRNIYFCCLSWAPNCVCSVCRVKEWEPVWALLTSAAAVIWWRSSVVASRCWAPEVGLHHRQSPSNLPSSTASCLHRWWQTSAPHAASWGSVIVSPPPSPLLLHWSLRFCFC